MRLQRARVPRTRILAVPGVLAAPAGTVAETASPQINTWPGYKRVSAFDQGSLPHTLLDVAQGSVVMVHTCSGQGAVFEIVDVDPDRPPASNDEIGQSFRVSAIETCRIQKLRKCPVYSKDNDITNGGTAFWNNGRLKTCLHTFSGWISKALEANPGLAVEDLVPPMALRTSRNKVLLSAILYPEQQFRIGAINPTGRRTFDTDGHEVEYYVDDYIDFEVFFAPLLGHVIDHGPPEVEHVRAIPPGTQSVVFGYPPAENPIGRLENGGLPGNALVASTGRVVQVPEDRLSRTPAFAYLAYTTAQTDPGSSGSPVLDLEGNLLGMTCGRTAANSDFISVHPETVRANWAD